MNKSVKTTRDPKRYRRVVRERERDRPMSVTTRWWTRVGADPWKNLIAEECKAITADSPPASQRSTAAKVAARRSSAFAFVKLERHAYLVSMIGRRFLVGAPRGIVAHPQIVAELQSHDSHLHVVLLTAAPEHDAGVSEICRTSQRGVTVWTSSWIWENVSARLDPKVRGNFRVHPNISLSDALPAWKPGDAKSPARVVVFDQELDFVFHYGAGLSLGYVPASEPSLWVRFWVNTHEIHLNPFGAGIKLDDLRDAVKARIRHIPALRPSWLQRYDALEQLYPGLEESRHKLDAITPSSGWHNSSLIRQEPGCDHVCYEEPVDVVIGTRAALEFTLPDQRATEVPLDRPDRNRAIDLSKETLFAILCGAFLDKQNRDILDPTRILDVGPSESRTVLKSILGLHLDRVSSWLPPTARDYPVLIMTSPDTHALVAAELRRFEAEHKDVPKLKLYLLRQQLVPAMAAPDVAPGSHTREPVLTPWEDFDGGWSLHPRGHLDFIDLLRKWQATHDPARARKVCLMIPYNNLADIFGKKPDQRASTEQYLRQAARSTNQFSYEQFRLRRPTDSRDFRWGAWSFAETETGPLMKKDFHGAAEAQPGETHLFMSLTWYFNLETLFSHTGCPACERYVVKASAKRSKLEPYRFLDQLTHCEARPWHTLRIEAKAPPEDIYGYPTRWLGVRTEDHLRDEAFRTRFRECAALVPSPVLRKLTHKTPSNGATRVPYLETEPVAMSYVWGGNKLSILKGLPLRKRIAETWEVSTHPFGTSMVHEENLLQSSPLSEALPRVGGKRAVPFIVKYLDCHKPLSIQIHPTQAAVNHLRSLQEAGGKYNIQDEAGKEESFFVLSTATHQDFNLFLGFDRVALAPVADLLRATILDLVREDWRIADSAQRIFATLEEFVTACWSVDVAGQLGQVPGGAPLADCRPSEDRIRSLTNIIKYHLMDGNPVESDGRWDRRSALGKEYILAAVGIIELIRRTAAFVKEHPEYREAAEQMFDYGHRESPGPLLKYFHRVLVRQGEWGRAPAGTVHSWQGGGNFLVELGQCSDNTFRILDFGREISDTPRDMHYEEASYALTEDGFVDEHTVRRLIEPGQPGKTVPCHPDIECRLFPPPKKKGQPGSPALFGEGGAPGLSVLLNPDGEVHLYGSVDGNFRQSIVGPCRAVVIAPGAEVEAYPAEPDDRLLLFTPRMKHRSLLCMSLGLTKREIALWQHGKTPLVRWRGLDAQERPAAAGWDHKQFGTWAREVVKEAKQWDLSEHEQLDIGVCWPGPIDHESALLYSSAMPGAHKMAAFATQCTNARRSQGWRSSTEPLFLNDASAAALGEHRHPLGRLQGDKPGMVLNIGSGICAGFFPGGDCTSGDVEHVLLAACGAIGRWLFVDPGSGRMRKNRDELYDAVFRGQVGDRDAFGWIRSSRYLSSVGVAWRFWKLLGAGDDHDRKAFYDRCWNGATRSGPPSDDFFWYKQGLEPQRFHVFSHIAEKAAAARNATGRAARSLVVQVGQDLAEVIRHVEDLLQYYTPQYADCTRRVVLTGSVGQYFGRLKDSDLLLEIMQSSLGDTVIQRSEIMIPSVREAAGFAHYFDLKDEDRDMGELQ